MSLSRIETRLQCRRNTRALMNLKLHAIGVSCSEEWRRMYRVERKVCPWLLCMNSMNDLMYEFSFDLVEIYVKNLSQN